MKKNSKIGVLGGTFNPVHIAHLMVAESAGEYLDLEKVIFVPSGCSYMKADIQMPEAGVRYEMTRLAVTDNPLFTVSDIEIRRIGNTYTYETVEQLTSVYPDKEIVFIVGADTLFAMDTWMYPERIFRAASIAAAIRNDKSRQEIKAQIAYLAEKYQADICLLPITNIEISSRDIRARIIAGQSVRYMLPEAVRVYILNHNIYTTRSRDENS